MAIEFPFTTNIAGVTFQNEDGTSRQSLIIGLYTGERLYLQDDSSPQYPEAIAVCNDLGEKLGYLPKYIAEEMRERFISYKSLYCLVKSSGRAGGSGAYGVTVSIAYTHDDALSLFTSTERRIAGFPDTQPVTYSYSRPSTSSFQAQSDYRAPKHASKRSKNDKLPVGSKLGIGFLSAVAILPFAIVAIFILKILGVFFK